MRIWSAGLLAIAMAALVSGTAGAQAFVTNPDGSLAYTAPYAFSGGFICGSWPSFVGASCANTGAGTVQLTSGTATIDLAFTGTSGTFTDPLNGANGAAPVTIPIGTVTVTHGGTGPFLFPEATPGYYTYFFQFNLALAGGGTITTNAYSLGQTTSLPVSTFAYFVRPLGAPSPAPFHYGAAVYDHLSPFTVGPDDAAIPLTAAVAVVPEPTSLVLLGTGLVGLVPFARRRRA